ncbi:homeobox-domain-containing protein [Backusella circina FSU 941]|nr:homeobox-domain-containing protein [Backusella circina FSU 941]
MQPFEQSFTVSEDAYYQQQQQQQDNYLVDNTNYNNYQENTNTGDFRPTFYNPFEIKHRRRTSRAQLKVLEKSFTENAKPNATVRRILAQQLEMTPRGVQIWFQNRRAKAKLQRRKSGMQDDDQHHHDSPVLFSQFFVNDEKPDNNMDLLFNNTDTWMPIHPLAAPVMETEDLMASDEWRSKSCPALGTLDWTGYNSNNILRRMTEPADVLQKRFSQVYPSDTKDHLNRAWSLMSPLSPGIDYYSPTSQQMTPMLSTGSPVSLDNYYDNSSCLDFIMSSSSTSLV